MAGDHSGLNKEEMKNIALIGFMGAGKTTVSHALRALYGLTEIDTDQEIVRQEGRPITEIFATEPFSFNKSISAFLNSNFESLVR